MRKTWWKWIENSATNQTFDHLCHGLLFDNRRLMDNFFFHFDGIVLRFHVSWQTGCMDIYAMAHGTFMVTLDDQLLFWFFRSDTYIVAILMQNLLDMCIIFRIHFPQRTVCPQNVDLFVIINKCVRILEVTNMLIKLNTRKYSVTILTSYDDFIVLNFIIVPNGNNFLCNGNLKRKANENV